MKKHIWIFILAFFSLFMGKTLAQTAPSTGSPLVLNGTNQLMKIPSHADFNIAASESFSISCWVKVPAYRNGKRFLAKRNLTLGDNAPGRAGYELWTGSSSTNFIANNTPKSSTGNVMSDWIGLGGELNQWYHICMVIDRAKNTISLYQNGVLGKSKLGLDSWTVDNIYDVTIGATHTSIDAFDQYFKGEITAVRFWKKALTAEEVIADKTAAVDNTTVGLVAAYDFKNIAGVSVPDISGHNHVGTLVNFPVSGPAVVASALLTQNTNFTGRGNDNESILKATLTMNGTEKVACQSLKLNMDGTTAVSDVKNIKIYSTGSVNKFDSRDVSTATLLGTCAPGTGDVTCNLTGDLDSGTNYLWITYQVADNAVEGNVLDASLLSITTANETYNLTTNTAVGSRTILLGRKLLFAPGDAGSKYYRIPAIITAKDGSLVVATDKRKASQADLPQDIDILVRRSTDNGKTWSDALTIAQGTGLHHGFGDAGLVRTKEEGGLLCIFVGGHGLFDGSTPADPIRTYICKSTDNGATWTQPRDITDQLFGANCPVVERQSWVASFCASGNGLLTKEGRIMFVAAVRETSSNSLSNYVFYSDDNGDTWKVSGRATIGGDESKVTELNDGTILMSIRRQGGGARYFNKSTDKGLTWGATKSSWSEMVEPNCNGDIIRYTSTADGYEKNRILHSVPNHASTRQNVSVFMSYDEAVTWPVKKSICATGSAYSSLCILKDGTIGAYVEENYGTDDYSLYYTNFSLNWLSDGADTYHAAGAIQTAAAPTFSVAAGSYEAEQTVSLATTTADAKIYYTLDGTTPSATSTLYANPIVISASTTVKAIVVKEGMANSVVASAAYSILLPGNYCIWEGSNRGGSDRVIKKIKVDGAHVNGELKDFTTVITTGTTQTLINIDKTADILEATLGDELVFSPVIYQLEWMHFYVYIDYNHNGVFEPDSNELVSYSYYQGKNSKGQTVANSIVPASLPSFIIPASAKSGSTRVRFKVDWDDINPCGNEGLARNRGALIDFTINIAPLKKYAVSFVQPTEGGTFTVKAGNKVVNTGEEIAQGTSLTVDAVPAANYKLSAIKVNGTAIEGNSFNVSGVSAISVEFAKKQTYAVTFSSSMGGTLAVKKGEVSINSGDLIEENTVLTVEATPTAGYQLRSLLLNEVPLTTPTYTVNGVVTIKAEFTTDKKIEFESNAGGTFSLTKADGTSITSGSWIENNSVVKIKAIPNEGYKIASATLNTVDISSNLSNVEGYSYTVDANTVINVAFAEKTYKLTYTFDATMGQVSVTQPGAVVNSEDLLKHGTVVTVNIHANPQHSVKSILLNGVEKKEELLAGGETFNLTITEETTLAIAFEADKYTLTYNTPKNGTMVVTLGDAGTVIASGSEIPFGNYLTLTFASTTGTSLNSLMINKVDRLSEVENNIFYCDILGSVDVEAEFTAPTDINNVSLGNLISYVNKDGHIVVEGAVIGSLIEVYDITGVIIAKATVQSNSEILSSVQLSNAFYLVKVSNGTESVVKRVLKK